MFASEAPVDAPAALVQCGLVHMALTTDSLQATGVPGPIVTTRTARTTLRDIQTGTYTTGPAIQRLLANRPQLGPPQHVAIGLQARYGRAHIDDGTLVPVLEPGPVLIVSDQLAPAVLPLYNAQHGYWSWGASMLYGLPCLTAPAVTPPVSKKRRTTGFIDDEAVCSDDDDDESDGSDDDFTVTPFDAEHSDAVDYEYTAEPSLETQHPVAVFDGHIVLHEHGSAVLGNGEVIDCDHTYIVRGEIGYISSTTLLHAFFAPFNPTVTAQRMVASRNWPASAYRPAAREYAAAHINDEPCPGPPEIVGALALCADGQIGLDTLEALAADVQCTAVAARIQQLCIAQICASWTHNAQLGTDMHEKLEDFFNGKRSLRELRETADEPELGQFCDWYRDWFLVRNLEPYRMELRIFHPILKICGSIDALFRIRGTDKLVMVDWKRARQLSRSGFRGQRGRNGLEHLDDCNLVHYQLQQNLYRRILYEFAGLELVSMHLAVFHPTHESWHVEDIPVLDAEIDAVYAYRQRTLE